MEYLGQTQTATYVTGPRQLTHYTHLPTIGTMQNTYKTQDIYPAPSPFRRSLTTFPWRPSSYYQSAKSNPAIAVTRSMVDPMSQRTQLSELDALKVPPVFAAARNALYTRFTPSDWLASNYSNYLASDRVRNGAERLRLDTVRLCREADDKTKRTQGDVGKRLGERLGDINFWKSELNLEIENIMDETNQLLETKRNMEKCLAETENPLHISQECLYHREKRQSVDLVHDNPEKELIKEVNIIQRCQDRMRHAIDKANVQLSLNRASQHELERDSNDKFMAENLDNSCHGLRNTSRGIAYHDGVHRIDNSASVPETWAKYSNNNIQRSQSERSASKNLRNELESIMNACSNEMWQKWNDVNVALSQRVKETTEARNKIHTHLSKVLQEVFDMEKNIELLKKAIQDKEAPMQVAQTRLETRLKRPNVELCRDPVQHRLVEEVGEITDTVDNLQYKLREAENTLQALLRTKAALEQDLSIKNNSLFIDREKCLATRKTFPMSPRIISV
uniref:Tektin n=1 Tax=Arion vulgaris TaxID=1028688 RepID=A0A0B7AUN0_9EUPU